VRQRIDVDGTGSGDRQRELLDALGVLVRLTVQVEVGAQRRPVRAQVARVLGTSCAAGARCSGNGALTRRPVLLAAVLTAAWNNRRRN